MSWQNTALLRFGSKHKFQHSQPTSIMHMRIFSHHLAFQTSLSSFRIPAAPSARLTPGLKTCAQYCKAQSQSNHVTIFDTTLRDGLLPTPRALSRIQRVVIAEQLAKLRVDVIEAGFPTLSSEDFATTREIASTVGNGRDPPIICALTKAVQKDIETCYEAISSAKFPRLHIYIPIPLSGDLTERQREALLVKTRDIITFARKLCKDIEFSPMNATSLFTTNQPFLRDMYNQAIEAGASTLSVPDTSGEATVASYEELIRYLRSSLTGVDNITISVHAHGPKEGAVRNSVEAVKAGARQVECTVLGIGEGMAALEDVVHQLKYSVNRRDRSKMWKMRIFDEEMEPTCRMVSKFMNTDGRTA